MADTGTVGGEPELDDRGMRVPADHPGVGGYRVTDVAALVGSTIWIGLVLGRAADAVDLGLVDLFVSLAVLSLVPVGLGLLPAATDFDSGLAYTAASVGQFPAAIAVVLALASPVGSAGSIGLAVPWLGVTGAIATLGVRRLRARGLLPLPDLAIDAALLYLPVGAVALVLHRAGISLRFEPIIILLTVVHYHYAGFALPLIAGLAGQRLTEGGGFGSDLAGRLGALATVVIVANLALIAVGITFSPLVEVIAVALFTVAVAAFAGLLLWRVVPTLPTGPATLLSVACLSLFLTMALALAYGYSAFPATGVLITIEEMIRVHGTVNAGGFALPALLAFHWLQRR